MEIKKYNNEVTGWFELEGGLKVNAKESSIVGLKEKFMKECSLIFDRMVEKSIESTYKESKY